MKKQIVIIHRGFAFDTYKYNKWGEIGTEIGNRGNGDGHHFI